MKGLRSEIKVIGEEQFLRLESDVPLRTICSTPWGGGFGYHSVLVNRQVPKNFLTDDPVEEMHQFLKSVGPEEKSIAGLMTSAWIKDVGHSSLSIGELSVSSWVTAGFSNRTRAGLTLDESKLYPGTINLIVVIDGHLTDAAMVNAVITATEAKAAALQELDIRLSTGELATGTSTDAIVIGCTGHSSERNYAGTATQLGFLVGKTVYEALMETGRKYLAYNFNFG